MDLAGYAAVAVGGFALGTLFGRKLATDAANLLRTIEARVVAMEQTFAGNKSASVNASEKHAAAVESHAAAVTKLAGAIEKHAAAVDDHGAATVAAAMETNAALAAHAAIATAPAIAPAKS
jgi:hypothetical protein